MARLRRRGASRILRARQLWDGRPDLDATRDYLSDPRNVFLLASVGSTPAGFLRGTALRQLRTRRPQMFLYEIGVDARFRRKGVGRALVRSLLTYCRRRGFDEVFVLTSPDNRAAVGLYRSTGASIETPGDRMYVYRLAPRPRESRGRSGANRRYRARSAARRTRTRRSREP